MTSSDIAVRLPLPPGTLATLWGSDDRFRSAYLEAFPGYYVGIGTVEEPDFSGSCSRPTGLPLMAQPVSVCHQ
jgi:hypothetical protein